MSEFYNGIIQGLSEAIAIERGELEGRKTILHINSSDENEEDENISSAMKR